MVVNILLRDRIEASAETKSSLLHILPPRIPKHLRGAWGIRPPPRNLHHLSRGPTRISPVLVETLQRSRKHLLKPDNHDTIRHTMTDHVSRHMKTSRAGAAVVVDIIYGDLCHAELVEDALAAGRVAIAVACHALVDVVIVDLGVYEGFDASFKAQLVVVDWI